MEGTDLLVRFFRAIGAEREAEMYFRLFKKTPPGRFAVLEVAPDLSPLSIGLLAPQIAILVEVGLTPILLHGPPHGDGRAKDRNEAMTETILASLALAEVEAEDFSHEFDEDGTPSRTAVRRICRAAKRGVVPLVSAEDLDATRAGLVGAVKPKKFVRMCEAGGLRDPGGRVIEYFNLAEEENEGLFPPVAEADLPFLREAEALLVRMGRRAAVQVAPPGHLLGELFLVRGTGTYIKRGRRMVFHRNLSQVSRSRLRDLIENAFGAPLVRDYFRRKTPPVAGVVLDPDYRGAAIVCRVGRLHYLDKFAVRRIAQGEGLGYDLWRETVRRFPRLFWRSRPDNPVNAWYAKHAQGCHRGKDWIVWWHGLAPSEIRRALTFAFELAPTLARD